MASSSYPDKFTYVFNRLANFKKQLTEFYPRNTRTGLPDGFTEIDFPADAVIDLSSFRILGDILLIRRTGTESTFRCLPRHIESYISHISVTLNDIELDGACTSFNQLWNVLLTMTEGGMPHRGVLQLGADYAVANQSTLPAIGTPALTVGSAPGTASVPGVNSHRWMLKDIPGFLSCGKVLDLSYLGRLKIRIKWADADIVPGSPTDEFQMQNIKCFVTTITYADDVYTQLMQSAIQSVGLSIPYKRYVTHKYNFIKKSSQLRFTVNTKSLDALYLVLNTQNAQNTVGAFDRDMYVIDTMFFEVESEFFPKFPLSMFDAYALTDMMFTDTATGLYIGSGDEWRSTFGYAGYRFSYDDSLDYVSGLCKLGDEALNGSVILKIRDDVSIGYDLLPLIFAECTSVLSVRSNRDISVTL